MSVADIGKKLETAKGVAQEAADIARKEDQETLARRAEGVAAQVDYALEGLREAQELEDTRKAEAEAG